MSGRWLACFRAAQVWVAARSDAPCVCMCARGRGNALFEHVFNSCGCHRGAVGLKSSPKDCTACLLQCCRARHGSRGHALAVGPSHCDYWLYRFVQDGLPEGSRLSPILFAICMSELLRQLQKDFPHAYMTVCRRRYFVRRRRHVRQQDSSRVSPRPACDAGCSMLHARVVFGRGWACVWRGAVGRGDGGGADWYALQDAEEASTDAVCSQNCQE